ncbi:MAG: CRISPR-associated protein Csx3 [Chloroflexota bacterium]|nr:CRISPR-associated protein Csx3 [Chloroflexota bacterium]
MAQFPAILIGGPPHSGKSVLTYSLTHALRQRGIQHYVIRAAPDGEGDWSNEIDQKLVRELRYKGDFTAAFTDFVCQSLRNRHLPLLVDMGGRPTPAQERIFDYCTHAILLTPEGTSRAYWRELSARHALPRLADLTSALQDKDIIIKSTPVLEGVLTGLERRHTASGPVFEALVEKVVLLFDYEPRALFRIHERLCKAELVIDLLRLARTFDVPRVGQKPQWKPHHLSAILNYLPAATPLGLYGRGTNWIYTAVSLLTLPAPFSQFDPRLGWVQAQTLPFGESSTQPLQIRQHPLEDGVYLDCRILQTYLSYDQLPQLLVPTLPSNRGVILGGRLPYWLYTSLVRTYQNHPWIAVYQPQLQGAIVVYSNTSAYTLGDCLQGIGR